MEMHPSRETLSGYVDGMLDAGQRGAVQAHVAICAGCRQDLDGLARLVTGLRQLERPEAPDLLPEIRRRLTRPEPAWRSLLDRVLAPWPASLPLHGAALAAAALLLVVVVRVPLRSAVREKSRLNAPSADQVSAINGGPATALRFAPHSGQADKKKAEAVVAELPRPASRTESSEEASGLGKTGARSSIALGGGQHEGVALSADDAWDGSYADRKRSQSFANQDRDSGWEREENREARTADVGRKPSAAPEPVAADVGDARGPVGEAAAGRLSASTPSAPAEDANAPAVAYRDALDQQRVEAGSELQARLERGDASIAPGKDVAAQEQKLDAAGDRLTKTLQAAETPEPVMSEMLDESRRAKLPEADGAEGPARLNERIAQFEDAEGDQRAGAALGAKEPEAAAGSPAVAQAPDASRRGETERGGSAGAAAPETAPPAKGQSAPERELAQADQSAASPPARLAPRLLELRWRVARPAEVAAAIRQWVGERNGLAVATTDQHLSIRLPEPLVAEWLAAFAPPDYSTEFEATPSSAPASAPPLWVTISLDLLPAE